MDSSGKVIGVVAGAGPFAGLDLMSKILHQTLANKDQDHLTVVSLSRPNQIVDRTEYLLGHIDVNPAYAIADQIKTLAQMGAEVAAIPCNTAHAPAIFGVIVDELQKSNCAIDFLHMIEEVAHHLRRHTPHVRCLGVLSTTGTYKAGVYPQVLQPAGFDVIVPDDALQEQLVHTAVYDPEYGIKAHGTASERARDNLMEGVRHLQEKGADAIVLGCTEMPLAITEKKVNGLPVIDPTLILARALVREANPAKLKPLSI